MYARNLVQAKKKNNNERTTNCTELCTYKPLGNCTEWNARVVWEKVVAIYLGAHRGYLWVIYILYNLKKKLPKIVIQTVAHQFPSFQHFCFYLPVYDYEGVDPNKPHSKLMEY